jgi:hypothetical protein
MYKTTPREGSRSPYVRPKLRKFVWIRPHSSRASPSLPRKLKFKRPIQKSDRPFKFKLPDQSSDCGLLWQYKRFKTVKTARNHTKILTAHILKDTSLCF